jgi:hypothetical protein
MLETIRFNLPSNDAGYRTMSNKGVTQAGNKRRVQIRAERKDGFTAEKRQTFLDHLAGCSNVSRAAEAVGFTSVTVNYHRRRDPVFAQACADALAAGYLALEASLLERAATGGRYEPGPGAEDAPKAESVDIGLGQFLMGLRAREMGLRTGATSGPRPQRATEKELTEAILKGLKLRAAQKRSRARAKAKAKSKGQ